MEVVVTTVAITHTSRQIVTINKPTPNFYRPDARPTNSAKAVAVMLRAEYELYVSGAAHPGQSRIKNR